MNGRLALVGTLVATGALLGCGQSSGKKKTAASTAPASTTSTTSTLTTTTTTQPAVVPSSAPAAKGLSIVSVSPDHGPLAGGTTVRISGSGFRANGAGTTIVLFGNNGALGTPVSDTELRVDVAPATSAGPVAVRIVNDLGTAVLASAFAYDARAAKLTFEPAVGHEEPGQPGTKITLSLADFAPLTGAPKVRFGTIDATAITLIDSSTVVAEMPAGLTPGKVAITVEEGGVSVSAADFLVQGTLAYGDLTVNEFCSNPGGVDCNEDGTRHSVADEFVEIVNTTANPIDLSYLTLRDAVGERHRFPNPTTVPAGGAIVVFGGGTVDAFTRPHRTGHAQGASTGDLGLNNTNDTIELRTLPGLQATGVTIFRVDYTTAPGGASLTNPKDGQRITTNPARSADYTDHSTAPGSKGPYSPGRKADGASF